MSLLDAYVRGTGKFRQVFERIQSAGVPERFTIEFLKTLGFGSSDDRKFIPVLKGLGFLDSNGMPTATYKAFRNPAEGPRVLAHALRKAYDDIFLANTQAQSLSVDQLKGIIATKISKGEAVVLDIARTFKSLADIADFSEPEPEPEEIQNVADRTSEAPQTPEQLLAAPKPVHPSFHYNIEIHLPTTTDISVYNAIFKSLKDNLL